MKALGIHIQSHFFNIHSCNLICVCILQVVGGKMTESGHLCAFITKVRKGSLADTVGHLRPGTCFSILT